MSMREVVEGEEVSSGTDDGGLSWANLPSLLLLPSTENAGSSSSTISNKLIHFILPLSGRFETFKRFIKNFEEVCLRASEKVQLTVVLFENPNENSFHQTEELLTALRADYKDTRISLIPVYDKFARAQALQLGSAHANSPDDLLFFIDVDIVFRGGALQRVRANTVKGKWVYFPIVFSEFDPKFVYALNASPQHFTLNNAAGYWRQYGFGIGSVYKTDLDKVGGFNTKIKGWGKEDVDLFEKFINATPPLKILRAPDPDLVHVFHPAECDPGLEEPQMKMCVATRSDTYGNTPQLASFIAKDKKLSRLLGLAVT